MSDISETYNETYNKPKSLLQSFGNSGNNSYITFLLLKIMLWFTQRKDWLNIKRSENIVTTVPSSKMSLMGDCVFFSMKKYALLIGFFL